MNVTMDVGLLFVVSKTLNRYNETELANRVIDIIERNQIEQSKRDALNEYVDAIQFATSINEHLGQPKCREIIRECRDVADLFGVPVGQRVGDDGRMFPTFPRWIIRHVMGQHVKPLAIIGGQQ